MLQDEEGGGQSETCIAKPNNTDQICRLVSIVTLILITELSPHTPAYIEVQSRLVTPAHEVGKKVIELESCRCLSRRTFLVLPRPGQLCQG